MPHPLTESRVSRYLSKRALARLAGVDVRTVMRAEDGLAINDVQQQRIAVALGVERVVLFPEPEPQEAVGA